MKHVMQTVMSVCLSVCLSRCVCLSYCEQDYWPKSVRVIVVKPSRTMDCCRGKNRLNLVLKLAEWQPVWFPLLYDNVIDIRQVASVTVWRGSIITFYRGDETSCSVYIAGKLSSYESYRPCHTPWPIKRN